METNPSQLSRRRPLEGQADWSLRAHDGTSRDRRGGRPVAVRIIIFLNVIVYLMWNVPRGVSPRFMEENFLVSYSALQDGRFWVLLTAVFSHNMFWHILINMIVLLSFGSLLEIVLGTRSFLVFYLGAGIISSLCHCLLSTFLLQAPELAALGASGAIAGLVLVFALMFPRQRILLFGIIPVPALWGALGFVGLDLWGLSAQAHGGGLPIGHGAHLGGALAGVLYYFLFIFPKKRKTRTEIIP